MADDWQTKTSLAETNLHMLEHEIMCDVTFIVGEKKRNVKAHKYMLVSRSPVFYAMFCGPMAESRDTVEVPDVEAEIFQSMIRFMYTTDCKITPDDVMAILYAAKKYGIEALVNKCKTFLESTIATDNVCVILQQAHLFDEQKLVKQCLTFIFENGTDVLKSLGFLSLSKDTLHMIIESDDLIEEEADVYRACVKWAMEGCKKRDIVENYENAREVFGDLINIIRFPCMTLDVFTSLIANGGLLASDEIVSVILQLTQNKKSKFNCKHRHGCKSFGNVLFERCTCMGLGNSWNNRGFPDAISFESSRKARLAGVCLYTPSTEGKVEGKLECLEGDRCLSSMDIELVYDKQNSSKTQLFNAPILIKKGIIYTLVQTLKGVGTYAGTNGQCRFYNNDIEIKFFNCELSKNGTNVGGGQFRGLIFK